MTFYVSPNGFDGEPRVNFDSLGKLYIAIAIIWTAIIFAGSGFLLYHRDLPALRVRNTHLWTTAVTFLHAYWVLCLIAYVLNGTYPCTAEFWIMSLWLPFGIALYQVNGMHLLHIASLQTRFIQPQALHAYRGSKFGNSGWLSLRNIGLPDSLSRVQKICILVGVVLQVRPLVRCDKSNTDTHSGPRCTDYLLCLEEVSSILGSGWARCRPWTMPERLGMARHLCGMSMLVTDFIRVPSIAWQFFWAWIYAPYLLWRVRKIHDLHGWRLQTTICCLAG